MEKPSSNLALKEVRLVNENLDRNGMPCALIEMIVALIGSKTNGKWEVEQLRPQLQNIS